MIRIFIFFFFFVLLHCSSRIYAQDSAVTIKVYFLYGSKPCTGYELSEKHLFGGIHGGHVSIGIDSMVIGFHHLNQVHIFPHRKIDGGIYECISMADFYKDTIAKKYAIIEIPISGCQYQSLKILYQNYLNHSPYDYAFFGMRCTAATYDVLSSIQLLPSKTKTGKIIANFYPRLLRKRIFKLAKQKQYLVTLKYGSKSRKWEKD